MLKWNLEKRLKEGDSCFVCGEKFNKDDEIREIFDKAFGCNVKFHKRHNYFSEEDAR
jgi:hypothetical protein